MKTTCRFIKDPNEISVGFWGVFIFSNSLRLYCIDSMPKPASYASDKWQVFRIRCDHETSSNSPPK